MGLSKLWSWVGYIYMLELGHGPNYMVEVGEKVEFYNLDLGH